MFDGQQLGEQLTVVVRDYVARSTATVTAQIDELRQRIAAIPAGEKGDRGEKGERGEPGIGLVGPQGMTGASGSAGTNGKDADEGFILGAIKNAVEAIPRPIVDYDRIATEIADAVKQIPPAKDGAPGRDGVAGIMGNDGPPGRDGINGKDADPQLIREQVAEQAERAAEFAADAFAVRLAQRLEALHV